VSASDETKEPNFEPRRLSSELPTVARRKGALSRISGAGVGSFTVWLVNQLHWTADWKLFAMAAAPWIAITISWLGPILTDVVYFIGGYIRAQFFLHELDKLADASPDDEVIKAKAREVRRTIAKLLADSAKRGWARAVPRSRR
jgi:hypothetical protein